MKKYFIELSEEECFKLNGGSSQSGVTSSLWDKLKGWLFGK